jgi:hypothetical protein
MGVGDEDDEVVCHPVYRALGEPVYRFRWLFFKLTLVDLFACVVGFVVAMNVTDFFHIGKVKFVLGLTVDPWGWFLLVFSIATGLSILHHLRPEGHVERIFQGLFAPRYYAPHTREGDPHWRPAPHRRLCRLRATGGEFEKRRRGEKFRAHTHASKL